MNKVSFYVLSTSCIQDILLPFMGTKKKRQVPSEHIVQLFGKGRFIILNSSCIRITGLPGAQW